MSKILLLEPSRLLAEQYAAVLGRGGHEIIWCRNGQDGVIAADSSIPDLLIAELTLAGHSGVEFLYEFRSYTEWQKIPAIVLTGVPLSETGLTDKVTSDLNIFKILYKPDITLGRLLKISNQALKAGAEAK